MKAKFASIYRCLAFEIKWTYPPANRGGLTNSPVVCGGGWLLALDHRRPVAQPAIRPANNLRQQRMLLSTFLIFLATEMPFGLGWARPSRLRKLASSDFLVDATADASCEG